MPLVIKAPGKDADDKPSLAIMIAKRATQEADIDKEKMFSDIGKDVRKALDAGDDQMLGKIVMAAARLSRDMGEGEEDD